MSYKEKTSCDVTQEINEEQVKNFLEKHPEFIEENHDVLLNLAISHSSGTATSLLEKQNSLLREKITEQRESRDKLVRAADENWIFLARINELTRDLAGINSLNLFYERISQKMCNDFGADKIIMEFIEKETRGMIFSRGGAAIQKLGSYFDLGRPFSGPVSEELEELYCGSERSIKSHVIVPMVTPEWEGILLLGSKDLQRYRSDVGIEFLSHLRDILVLGAVPVIRYEKFIK